MSNFKPLGLEQVGLIPATLLALSISTTTAFAQENKQANKFYNPTTI